MAARHAKKLAPQGYALLMMLFFLALLVIAVAAAVPNVITQARREKEQEMIWRGQQYVRGIRLYYQKMHRFPARLEDLYAPKTGIRFLRHAYKDPMNSADGSWRLISVGPNGQLIGSLKEHRNAFFFGAAAPQGFAGALSPVAANSAIRSSFSDFSKPSPFSNDSNATSQTSGTSQVGGSVSGGQSASPDDNSPNSDSQSLTSTAASLGARDQIFGQTIIGVGSKINRSSILRYDGAKNYLQFEFVWDASTTTSSGIPAH